MAGAPTAGARPLFDVDDPHGIDLEGTANRDRTHRHREHHLVVATRDEFVGAHPLVQVHGDTGALEHPVVVANRLAELLFAGLRQFAGRLLLPLAVVYGLMVGLGILVTKVLDQVWPLTAEDAVSRELERERDAAGNGVSLVFSAIGSTPAIIAVTALVALVLVLRGRRWRAALFLAGVVSAQALIFLFTTMVIDRERTGLPPVELVEEMVEEGELCRPSDEMLGNGHACAPRREGGALSGPAVRR